MILTVCQEQGAQPQTFRIISQQLGNKTPTEVSGACGSPKPRGTMGALANQEGDTNW